MPPRLYSRNTYTLGIVETDKNLLTLRKRYTFASFADNKLHTVADGDSLFSLAGVYFQPLPRPSGLWWIIADFQPQPIHDPTLKLEVGRVLVIPSVRTVLENIFNEDRRLESDL